jgi:putative nucleotidyltransferase with HDIG domain
MTMRFRTRAFLICFVPFAVLLAASFWMIQRFVQSTVSDDMRASLRENQLAISRIHAKSNLQNSRFLKVAGENPALKAGMQLLISERSSRAARQTVEDQLHELGEHMGFDLLMVFAPGGEPLAGVIRKGAHADSSGELVPINTSGPKQGEKGLLLIDGRIMQVASVPIDENDENIGYLSVGEYFDFSEFITPAVLIDNGRVIESNVPNISLETLNKALKACPLQSECELQMGGATWVSLPVQALSDGTGDVIRTLENVDAATGPVQARLRHLFFAVALGSVLIVFLCSVASARTIVKPIATVVAHLRNSTWIGELPEFQSDLSSPIVEIRELAESYNWAAISIKKARESLQRAYVEFVGSLANALDARDRYTAGHSWRVSQLSCALAAALGLDPDEVERVRVGALLHDIGKIGVSDSVLQKAGRLTDEEFALVKEHPVTGLRILQGVQGFAPFLAAVELHHENWDGTGYPRGLVAKQVPVDARIIHVADAYDAMTTDRSYRPGMKHERAIQILEENAGTQFDPTVVQLLTELPREIVQGQAAPPLDVGKQEVVEVA